VESFRWSVIQAHLPLQLPTRREVPPWTGRLCRSYFRWLPIEETLDLQWLNDFGLVLRLFDFSGWRPYLASPLTSMGHGPGAQI
jgi:hypothetical protein